MEVASKRETMAANARSRSAALAKKMRVVSSRSSIAVGAKSSTNASSRSDEAPATSIAG